MEYIIYRHASINNNTVDMYNGSKYLFYFLGLFFNAVCIDSINYSHHGFITTILIITLTKPFFQSSITYETYRQRNLTKKKLTNLRTFLKYKSVYFSCASEDF